MKIFLNIVTNTMYRDTVNSSHGKYAPGSGAKPMDLPKGVKGITVKTAMPAQVSRVSGAEARLWINGTFGVRIMWITRVCVHMDSRTILLEIRQ